MRSEWAKDGNDTLNTSGQQRRPHNVGSFHVVLGDWGQEHEPHPEPSDKKTRPWVRTQGVAFMLGCWAPGSSPGEATKVKQKTFGFVGFEGASFRAAPAIWPSAR